MPSAGSKHLITGRDREVLLSLYKHGVLTTAQVRVLHFPSLQTAGRRLRTLRRAGYVESVHSPGVEELLDLLTAAGMEVVARALGVPVEDLERQRPREFLVGDASLRFQLAATDFRIALTQACTLSSTVALLGFLPAHLAGIVPQGDTQRYIRAVVADIRDPRSKLVHTPDAVFALECQGRVTLCFLEVDRRLDPTADLERSLRRVLRFYASYRQQGGYERYRSDFEVASFDFVRLLLVTASERRLEELRAHVLKTPRSLAGVEGTVWLASAGSLSAETILAPAWKSIEPRDRSLHTLGSPRAFSTSPSSPKRRHHAPKPIPGFGSPPAPAGD